MTQKFKTGDKVKLNSGSPILTVDSYNPAEKVVCIWYSPETGDFKTIFINESCLRPIE